MSETQGKGAVIMMDALGFKEYARGKPANQILEFMEGAFELAETYVPETVTVTFLSDTVVFSSSTNRIHEPESAIDHIEKVCSAAATFMRYMVDPPGANRAASNPPLNFRGAISYGEVSIRKTFLVGNAINEAAALHEMADGAFVFAAPSLLGLFLEMANESRSDPPTRSDLAPRSLATLLTSYDVPLTDGKGFETLVLNPLATMATEPRQNAQRWNERSLAGFKSLDLRVLIKATNTERFLRSMLERVFS